VPSKSASAKKTPSSDQAEVGAAPNTTIEDPGAEIAADPAVPGTPIMAAEEPPEPAKPAASPSQDDVDGEAEEDGEAEPEPIAVVVAANDSAPPRPISPSIPMPQRSGMPGGGSRPPGGMQGGRVMPPPRAMAKAEQFAEGDHVVYPTHGVGKVERIATEEIAGHKLELIHITFEENRMTLRVPVAKARSAGLRKLASRKMFDEALAVLKGRARIKRTMWSRRAQEYEAKINSGDPLAIAEVVRDLHRNAGQPDQSFSERQIYEAAMDRLAAELGALERIDKAAASVKLAEFLKTV
jgi:CarD family transcriptional regulator